MAHDSDQNRRADAISGVREMGADRHELCRLPVPADFDP
jgi:hypothetical protein